MDIIDENLKVSVVYEGTKIEKIGQCLKAKIVNLFQLNEFFFFYKSNRECCMRWEFGVSLLLILQNGVFIGKSPQAN